MDQRTRLRDTAREHKPIIGFGAAFVVGFTAYGLSAGSRLTVPYAVIVAAAGVFVAFVHNRVGLSRGVLWALALWGLLHMAGGLIEFEDAVLYNVDWGIPFLRFDRLVHMIGFGTASVVCWQTLRGRLGITTASTAAVTLAWSGGMGVGAFNEMVEFILSQITETNVGGFVNTGYDLIANAIGCTAVAVWLRIKRSG